MIRWLKEWSLLEMRLKDYLGRAISPSLYSIDKGTHLGSLENAFEVNKLCLSWKGSISQILEILWSHFINMSFSSLSNDCAVYVLIKLQ